MKPVPDKKVLYLLILFFVLPLLWVGLLSVLSTTLLADAPMEEFYIPLDRIPRHLLKSTIGVLVLRVPDIIDSPRKVFQNKSGKRIDSLKMIPTYLKVEEKFIPDKVLSLIKLFPLSGFDWHELKEGLFPIVGKKDSFRQIVIDPVHDLRAWINLDELEQMLSFPVGCESYSAQEFSFESNRSCWIPVDLYILAKQAPRVVYEKAGQEIPNRCISKKIFVKTFEGLPVITRIMGNFAYVQFFPWDTMQDEDIVHKDMGWIKMRDEAGALSIWPSWQFNSLIPVKYSRHWFVSSLAQTIRNRDLFLVRLLLDEGLDANGKIYDDENSLLPLDLAIDTDAVEIARLLLKKGSGIDTPYKDKSTPLMRAVRKGSVQMVKLLIDTGTDVNARDNQYETALNLACKLDEIAGSVVRILIAAGVDVNAVNSYHDTPLADACERSNLEVARLLIEAGASIERKNHNGEVPLLIAIGRGDGEMTAFLIKSGADLEVRNMLEQTPFLVAARKGHLEIARRLATAGADIEARDVNGDTALELARSYGRQEMIQYLTGLMAGK